MSSLVRITKKHTQQNWHNVWIHIIALVIVFVFWSWAGIREPLLALAKSSSATTVTISPNPASINGCETKALEVWVNDVNMLYGADIQISFNPGILEVQDDDPIKSGVQVQNGGFLSPDFVLYNTADNINGLIRYTLTQLNPTLPVSGSGKLIVIHVKAKTSGVSAIHFTQIELANKDGGIIPASGTDGSVTTVALSSPTLSINKINDTDARLSWTSVSGVSVYRLYRGTTPYFPVVDPPYQTTLNTQLDDAGVLGDPATNYYYAVKAVCPNGTTSQASNRVGEFDFALVRNASNTIALPLIDPALQTADQLGAATGATKVSEWVAESSAFRTRIVGVTGTNFGLLTGHGYFIRTSASANPAVFTTIGGVPEPGSVTFSIYRQAACKLNLLSLPLDHPELDTALDLASDMGGVPKISEWIANISGGYFRTYVVGIGPVNFATRPGYPYWPCADTTGGGIVWP